MEENKLGVMPIKKLLISMSLPIMISMLVQALYNVVDSIFVAQINENALTAVSLAFPVQNLMIAIAVGTGVGSNALLSKTLGEKNFQKADDVATNSVFLGLLSYSVFLMVGLLFSRFYFLSQTSDAQIIEYGVSYLSIICIGSFGKFIQITFERLLQSTGKTFYSMMAQGIGAINSTQAEVKFNKEVKEVKPANFKVTDIDGNLLFVSKAELNEEKTVATLSFFDAFADKGVYTVEVSDVADVDGNVMEKATAKFGYEKADVKSIEFTTKTLATDDEIKDIIKVTDELGRDVTKEVELTIQSSKEKVINKNGIALAEGESVVVVGVKGTDIKTTATVVTVQNSVKTTFVGYNVYVDGNNPADDTEAFLKLDEKDKMTYVAMEDADKKLALYYNDQYGDGMDAVTTNFTVTNLTPDIVIVNGDDGKIMPISVGTGYVKVKVEEVETTIKIEVKEKSKVTKLELDKTDLSVVEKATVGQKFEVKFKDQYGGEITKIDDVDLKATAKVKDDTIAKLDKTTGTEFTVTGLKEGTTTIEVSYKVDADTTLKETVNVEVTKADDFAGYEAAVDTTELDLGAEDENNKNKAEDATKVAEITVYKLDAAGNRLDTETADLIAVDKDGDADESIVKINTDRKIEAVNVGTGYVQVKVGSLVVDTIEFTVINTASTVKTAEVDSLTLSKKISEVKKEDNDNNLEGVLKGNLTFRDQYGEKQTVEDNNITVDYVLTNADGVSYNGKEITGIKKDKATIDITLTEVKTTNTGDKNLLAAPVVIKLQVNLDDVADAILDESDTVVSGVTKDTNETNKIKATFGNDVVDENGKITADQTLSDLNAQVPGNQGKPGGGVQGVGYVGFQVEFTGAAKYDVYKDGKFIKNDNVDESGNRVRVYVAIADKIADDTWTARIGEKTEWKFVWYDEDGNIIGINEFTSVVEKASEAPEA